MWTYLLAASVWAARVATTALVFALVVLVLSAFDPVGLAVLPLVAVLLWLWLV